MTFVLPTANNAHTSSPTANARHLASIGSPTSVGVKSGGNLPISTSAGDWENNSAGVRKGMAFEFQASQAAWDVSGDTRLLVWHTQLNAPNRIQLDTLANDGVNLRIYSGTGSPPTDYKEYQLGGNDTPWGSSVRGAIPFVIDLNDTSNEASAGTFDNTDVTSYALLCKKANIAGGSSNWNYQTTLYVFTTIKGSISTPTFSGAGADFEDAVILVQGSSYTTKIGNWVRKVGSVIFIDVAFRIGNNSTVTTFDDEGLTIISPVSDDPSDPRNRLTTQACRVYLDLRNSASDTADFSGTYFWGTRAPWDFDQDDAAVVTFASPTFNGMGDFTIGSSITGPATWNDVGAVIAADTSVDIDGSTFRNAWGTHLLELSGAMNITDMTFETYAAATAALHITTAGSYTLDNCTFDGSGIDIENSANATSTDSYADTNQDGNTQLYSASNNGVGQGITGDGNTLSNIQFYLRRVGTPLGDITVSLYAHTGTFGTSGTPTGSPLAVADTVLAASDLTTSYVWYDFQFTDEFTLVNTTNYFIVLEFSGGTSGNRVEAGHDASSPSHGGNLATEDSGWTADSSQDLIFEVSTGGIVTITSSNGSNPTTSIRTGTPPGAVIINTAVSLSVHVEDASGANLENVRVAIYRTSDGTELMNEDTTAAGDAVESFNYPGSVVAVTVRIRESPNTASGRYIPFFTSGVINASGYSLDVILSEDSIASVTS